MGDTPPFRVEVETRQPLNKPQITIFLYINAGYNLLFLLF